MDLKTCRWMTRLLYVGCLALAIIALPLDNQILRMGLLGAALALALMVAMVRDSGAAPSAEKCSPKGARFAANPVGGRCCRREERRCHEVGFLLLGCDVPLKYGNVGAFTGVQQPVGDPHL